MTEKNNPPTYEEAFSRLESILDAMNSGKITLEESLKLYEEADKLIAHCNQTLTSAEEKIETLIKNREGQLQLSADGTPQKSDFTISSNQKFSV